MPVPFVSDLLVWTIRGYQRMISYYTPPVCRFHPTCSRYAIQALQTHGPVRGAFLAAWRILRCNPFTRGGYDPVPSARGSRPELPGEGDRGGMGG